MKLNEPRAELARLKAEHDFILARYDGGALPICVALVLRSMQEQQREIECEMAWLAHTVR